MRFQPVWLFHFKPGTKRFKTKLQHPLWLVTLGRDRPHHIFIDAVGKFFGLQLGKEALFVVELAFPDLYIVRCFAVS